MSRIIEVDERLLRRVDHEPIAARTVEVLHELDDHLPLLPPPTHTSSTPPATQWRTATYRRRLTPLPRQAWCPASPSSPRPRRPSRSQQRATRATEGAGSGTRNLTALPSPAR